MNEADDDKKNSSFLKENSRPWWQPALIMSAKLSGWIALPVLLGVFIGNWLDKKYGTEPWLFLATVGVAFLISMAGLVIEAKKEFGKIERDAKLKIKNQNEK
jgi:F0F1-type ATP synthase assembly protein I